MKYVNDMIIPIMERLDRIESLLSKSIGRIQKLMTIKDISMYCNLSETTIRRGVMNGTLKPFKDTGKKLFRRQDVHRWLNG